MDANTAKEGDATQTRHNEDVFSDEKSRPDSEVNLVYNDIDEEPEIHFRTYVAVAAMLILNYVQIIALQGPPVVVSWKPELYSSTILTT